MEAGRACFLRGLGLLWQRRVRLRRVAGSRRRRIVAAGDGLDPPLGKLREKRWGREPVSDQFPSVQENRLLRWPGEQAPARRLVRYLEFGAVQGIPDVADHDLRTCWVRHAGNRSTAGVRPLGIRRPPGMPMLADVPSAARRCVLGSWAVTDQG